MRMTIPTRPAWPVQGLAEEPVQGLAEEPVQSFSNQSSSYLSW
ncbi:MAG: hypothetical protein ACI8TP_001003 [Acidimicrobiales bacterium]|jgi:hypothetical protein